MKWIHETHIAKIEKQSDHSLQNAFSQLCEDEINAERKLDMIREVKIRILIEIELRNKKG